MNKAVIFGAGQSGKMIKKLIHGMWVVSAYADNNYSNLPESIDCISVISPDKILEIKPDKIIISILNKDAAIEIYNQLIQLGIDRRKILNLNNLRELFDARLSVIRLLADEINRKEIKGSIAELGVYKGYIARELNILFKDRKLYLFDTFEGFDDRDLFYENKLEKSRIKKDDFKDTSIEVVKEIIPFKDKVVFCKGYFPETADKIEDKYALVSLDTDLYLPTLNGLKYFYPRLSKGGCIIVHDYNSQQFPNVKKAVDDFYKTVDINVIPICDLHGSAVIV
ncbi:MAG: TylF/MycF/NovP-related O-methyltransferase [Bacillota bacterium]|nr:TylF/MycF/NovP-related O-methyltransferase [Bacillota bacterium]